METRNYLKRAHAFLRNANKLSLKVAPLALAAASMAHAVNLNPSYTFVSGSTSTVFCSSGASCFVSGGGLSGNSPQLPGVVSLYSNGPVFFSTSGGSGTVGLFWTGTFNPNLSDGQNVPFSWDFTLNGNTQLFWSLTLSGALTGFASGGTAELTALSLGTPFSGSGFASSSSGTNTFNVELDVSTTGNDFISVDVQPAGTIDVDLSNPASVPEPASAMLIAPALGGLWMFRRRRKRA